MHKTYRPSKALSILLALALNFSAINVNSVSAQGVFNQTPENSPAKELVEEAEELLLAEKPLDARSKLLKALKSDPKYYLTHIMLTEYYMHRVGHNRLAFRYLKQAKKLFREKHGKPPFKDFSADRDNALITYLMAQVKLSLDNYKGSLEELDKLKKTGYLSSMYFNSRAWVLMKLGRIKEAIEISKQAVNSKGDMGRSLNMLGILYSMNGDPKKAITIFDYAIRNELSQGENGSPATPMNNVGEVFREQFQDKKAKQSWQSAKQMRDGCEHVLPSINLSLLLFDHLDIKGVKRSIESFESCVQQYTVRNDEDYKALVALIKARVNIAEGEYDDAIKKLTNALNHVQWFGKIGTSSEDLETAVLTSLVRSYKAKANILKFTPTNGIIEWFAYYPKVISLKLKAWWAARRARFILTSLNDFEDLYIRHTDSMLDYAQLGGIISTFPISSALNFLESIKKSDSRKLAKKYYDAYKVEVLFNAGRVNEATKVATNLLKTLRLIEDSGLLTRLKILLLKQITPKENLDRYIIASYDIAKESIHQLKENGLIFPVVLNKSSREHKRFIEKSGYLIVDKANPISRKLCQITASKKKGGDISLKLSKCFL